MRTALRRLAHGQDGSFLVEALASSLIIVIVGLGVLESIDRSAHLGTQQEAQAVAGNVAQTAQETVRAMPVSRQSNLRETTTRTVNGTTFSISSRADWVNDASGDADCTTPGATADYMKLSTVVTWPNMERRSPVTLESIITPAVRSFGAGQGSLAVKVTDRAGAGVGGLQLNLSGPTTLSDTTSASGCVLWGYLDAVPGYMLGFSRPPDYVAPSGATTVSMPVAVVGDQTSNVAVQYDRGGYLTTQFTTKRSPSDPTAPTYPLFAHVTNSGGGGVSRSFDSSGDQMTTGLLFPFTSAYTIHADKCASTEVPSTTPFGPPPAPVSATVLPGSTASTAKMRLPALNILVTRGGNVVNRATIVVTTPCGTVYRRTTNSDGLVDDPGFPYAARLDVCVDDGQRKVTTSSANQRFSTTDLAVDIPTSGPQARCP